MVKKQNSTIIYLLCIILLSGCVQKEIVYVDNPIEVKVPVYIQPTIEPIEKPILPINKLSQNSTNKEVIEAYYNTVLIQEIYITILEEKIKPFYKNNE